MFAQAWNKYLPVLRILLKRSLNEEQTLAMDAADFQRAAGGRKIKYSFSVIVHKGRMQTIDKPPAIAKDFVAFLQQDDITRQFIRQYDLEFSLSTTFQLIIKNITPPAVEISTGDPAEKSEEE